MTNNALAFVALCNEYCAAVENCLSSDPREFTREMLRLLPRLYICAADLDNADALDEGYIDSALDETTYDSLRRNIERIMGEDDTYLEVFEDDMKYSDTPIGASVAESLADLFQVFYNLLEAVRDVPDYVAESALATVRSDFGSYWGQTLCNVLRPLNAIYYKNYDRL